MTKPTPVTEKQTENLAKHFPPFRAKNGHLVSSKSQAARRATSLLGRIYSLQAQEAQLHSELNRLAKDLKTFGILVTEVDPWLRCLERKNDVQAIFSHHFGINFTPKAPKRQKED